ncbi:hypothetical protein ARMSODRAFT_639098 [Armillaria solidipes]|uniref:Uncharacterized protein n=1 Tax=Armillaria solidipes TaxID=1076256 RepID=A0A2H3BX48_9AGAR|nr:hypothetical protein ARMSODRAFT_639098 [Armillaria solidipes]
MSMAVSCNAITERVATCYIPPDLTDDRKAYLYQYRDGNLNSTILYALLHGVYTGILAVTLWNISTNKCWPIRRALIVIIIVLYALTTINFAATWSYIQRAFIDNGQSFWTESLKLNVAQAAYLETGITSSMSTVLADLYMVRVTPLARGIVHINSPWGAFPMLYLSFVLATTLWCTLLIIFRILTVTGVRRGVGGRLKVFRHFIGVLVESSALYSIALILSLACFIHNDLRLYYFGVIAGIVKVRSRSYTRYLLSILCRELHPLSLLVEQRQDTHAQTKNMTKLW